MMDTTNIEIIGIQNQPYGGFTLKNQMSFARKDKDIKSVNMV
jgi:hypothetical protein